MRISVKAVAFVMMLNASLLSTLATAGQMEVVRTGIPHQAFFGIDFEKDYGLVVGAAGDVYESKNGGASWEKMAQTKTQLSLMDVSIKNQNIIAVGQMGTVLSKTASSDWQLNNTNTDKRLLAVDQSSSGLAVAVGQFGLIMKSSDFGRTWSEVQPDWSMHVGYGFEPQLYDVNVDSEEVITVVGEFGIVIQSVDKGLSWNLVRKGESIDEYESSPSLWAIDLDASGVGFAVGQDGLIIRTEDHGKTWVDLSSNSNSNLQDVYMSADGRVTVVGIRELLSSSDSGQSWKKHVVGDIATGWYQKMASPESRVNLLAVGHSGRIVKIIQ